MQMNPPDYLILALTLILICYVLFSITVFFVGRKFKVIAWISVVPDCIILFKRLLGDPEVPRSRKIVLLAILAYLVLPIDIIPDFIPFIGQLDDIIIAVFLLRRLLKSIGADKVRSHWPGSEKSLSKILKLTKG